MRFAGDGSLETGDLAASPDGSALARQILPRALNSGFVFIIEDHSGSPAVNFGQSDEGLNYEDEAANLRLLVWRARLDFSDFRQAQASLDVRDSFDLPVVYEQRRED